MKILFGVCDDECVWTAHEQVQKTERSNDKIVQIAQTQTSVIKIALKEVGVTTAKLNNLYQEITTKEKSLVEKINEVNNTTRNLQIITLTNELHNVFNEIIMQFA